VFDEFVGRLWETEHSVCPRFQLFSSITAKVACLARIEQYTTAARFNSVIAVTLHPRVWAIECPQTPHCNEIVMMNGSERVKSNP
jgi:hypothetical protein